MVEFGEGHLMTRKDYDTEHLISLLKKLGWVSSFGDYFRTRFGFYLADRTFGSFCCRYIGKPGIKPRFWTFSFTCHMPDCLEMPYQPAVRGAKTLQSMR